VSGGADLIRRSCVFAEALPRRAASAAWNPPTSAFPVRLPRRPRPFMIMFEWLECGYGVVSVAGEIAVVASWRRGGGMNRRLPHTGIAGWS
jgi:hypothetical protein